MKRGRRREATPREGQIGAGPRTRLLVDGHVHFYEAYDETRFFNAAVENFSSGASQLGCGDWAGYLVLTEGFGIQQFDRFAAQADGAPVGPWRFKRTAEDASLVARHESGMGVILVSGRQIVTAEGLEVLAWATTEEIPDGLAVEAVLERLAELGVISVIPWGFGKWWFARGGALNRLLDTELDGRFYLADSGCRARLSPYPGPLRRAKRGSRPVLAGSDPLPLAGEDRRAGSFGFELAGPADWRAPAARLVERVRELDRSPRLFGRYEGLTGFGKKQVAMQLIKRRRVRQP